MIHLLTGQNEEAISLHSLASKNNQIVTDDLQKQLVSNFPKEIQLKTIDYYFEILFWGLRKIKNTNISNFGKDKLFIQVAMGVDDYGEENMYTSKKCERIHSNDNFLELRHQRFIVHLPESDEYKPYLNIRCLSQGQFDISNDLVKSLDLPNNLINKVKFAFTLRICCIVFVIFVICYF